MSKRGADRQITSDDRECSDDDEQNNDVKGIRRAAPEELALRRKVTAKKPTATTESVSKPNLFASIILTPATGTTVNVSTGFHNYTQNPFAVYTQQNNIFNKPKDTSEDDKSTSSTGESKKVVEESSEVNKVISPPKSTTRNPFASPVENPFVQMNDPDKKSDPFNTVITCSKSGEVSAGSKEVTTNSKGEDDAEDDTGNGNENDDLTEIEPDVTNKQPLWTVSDTVVVSTGEEQEECKVKLFRWRSKEEASSASNSSESHPNPPQTLTQEWIEVGVGPLRLLRSKDIASSSGSGDVTGVAKKKERLLMRRDDGQGNTSKKIILNMLLHKSVTVAKQGEKTVRISGVNSSDQSNKVPQLYLIKTKASDTDVLFDAISTAVQVTPTA